jgi:hypothetical protein
MKAIFIDSANEKIKQIEVSGLKDLQAYVNGYVEIALTVGNNVIYVDEEGLYKGYGMWFKYGEYPQPFTGNGIVIGYDPDTGDEVDVSLTVEQVKAKVKFIPFDRI